MTSYASNTECPIRLQPSPVEPRTGFRLPGLRRNPKLSILIPGLLLLTGAADVLFRLLPPTLFSFRGWEAMTMFANAEGPFIANGHYVNERSFGDLSNLGNLRTQRQFRREVFTTDSHGFRNTAGPSRTAPAAVLFGDSFAGGAGLEDRDTLSAQLGRLQSGGIYNSAPLPIQFDESWSYLASLPVSSGVVIWQISERAPIPGPPTPRSSTLRGTLKATLASRFPDAPRRVARAEKLVSQFAAYSPLRIEAGRAYRIAQNDFILPNAYRDRVVSYTLKNGQPMLFLPSEVSRFRDGRSVDTRFATELNRRARALGHRLLIVLVPDKYVVYHPVLRDAPPAPDRSPLYMDSVEASLREADIAVVNLTAVFRARAAEALERGEYIYWLDDTHWNGAGTRVAAEEIARRLR
jgi:hypothetical protein